jgi:hypothetical protein
MVVFRTLAQPLRRETPVRWLAAGALVLIAVLHGGRWPTERAIQNTAGFLHAWLPWCS